LAKTRQFYEDFPRMAEPFTLPQRTVAECGSFSSKSNDHQYFEIFNEKDRGEGN